MNGPSMEVRLFFPVLTGIYGHCSAFRTEYLILDWGIPSFPMWKLYETYIYIGQTYHFRTLSSTISYPANYPEGKVYLAFFLAAGGKKKIGCLSVQGDIFLSGGALWEGWGGAHLYLHFSPTGDPLGLVNRIPPFIRTTRRTKFR